MMLVKTDEKAAVRAAAINFLSENYKDNDLNPVYDSAIGDKAYSVASAALMAIAKQDSIQGLKAAKQFENDKSIEMLLAVMHVYAKYGSDENNAFFVNSADQFKGYYKIGFVVNYGEFLKKVENYETLNSGVDLIASIATDEQTDKYTVYYSKRALKQLETELNERIDSSSKKLKTSDNANENGENKALQDKLEMDKKEKQRVTDAYNSIK
jgi:hypothetical protein